MSSSDTSYSQLGKFIFGFQHIESQVDELLMLLPNADEEFSRILIHELGFAAKLRTLDVVFSRFIDIRRNTDPEEKKHFHKLIQNIEKLAQRRNALVHSRYYTYQNIKGELGLLRENSRLISKRGIREESEEELLPKSFKNDLDTQAKIANKLEDYRLKAIDILYGDESA